MTGIGGAPASRLTATPPTAVPPRIVPSSAHVTGSSSTFDLDEGQKRWLVISICLNKVLPSTLRDFIRPEIQKHYLTLKTNHNIDKQTYPGQLKKDKGDLNYGSINNNYDNHKKNVRLYDYNVKSEVDLAKLYFLPFMAKFSGLDDTCDLSAVLGILSSSSVFSSGVQNLSDQIKKDVRNMWGHCNFNDWSKIKFLDCFKLIDSLVRALKLPAAEEKRVTDELADWETKGVQLCMGNMVDADLVKLVQQLQQEVAKLLDDVKRLENQENDKKKIINALQTAQKKMEECQKETKKRLESLKQSQESTNKKVEELGDVSAAMVEDVGILKTSQNDLENEVTSVKQNQEVLTRRIDEGEQKYENLDKRVEALETAIETRSSSRTINAFQAPNRIPYFHGRTKELAMLAQPLKGTKSPCNVTAVHGLGGTGKTSLAIEHIWKNKEAYSGGVFWISGESNSLFNLSVSEMARQIGTFDDDFKTTLSKTLDWLQTRRETWCLVIDNLDELELSTDMMKLVGGHWKRIARGHIVITTRRERTKLEEDIPDIAEGNCIELHNLTETESVDFMKKRTERPDEADDVVIGKLVLELGCLPLALDQAAAYIKNMPAVSFAQYLELYNKLKLKTLKRSKAHYPVQDTSTDRIAVHTTWQLNFDYVSHLSEEYGIGQAAAVVMEISAFLSPDDIPNDVINQGLPQVDNKDLLACLSTTSGIPDLLSVLTKFSLFQKFSDKSFSVHRLVQEVIRDKVSQDNLLKEVLQCATRMLYHAFDNNRSPVDVCKSFQGDSVFHQDNPPSLYLWGKLGAHARVLQSHLIETSQKCDVIRQEVLYSEESLMLLNQASIYLSVCRQTKEAMELKASKLKILTQLEIPLTEEILNHINFFDIPLKDVEFKLISHCMTAHESATNEESEIARKRREADCLREKGNEAVKRQNYEGAIDLYTDAIEIIKDDPRLYNNRALCELKLENAENALRDCESCLKLQERNGKALMRKAWALYELSKKDDGQKRKLEGRMKATAALALHVDPTLTKDKRFNNMFPNVDFEEIFNSSELSASFMYSVPGKTYLLHDGYYELHGAMPDVDMQLVALTSHQVSFKFRCLGVLQSSLYAEGIIFAKDSGSIVCQQKGSLDFFNCKISGGFRCCKGYPNCNGGPGCIAAKFHGKEACNRTGMFGSTTTSGMYGTPSILVVQGSTCNLELCDVTKCGGKGILCRDDGSTLRIVSCRVFSNPQSGIEAYLGGSLVADNNEIYSNGFHGIFISPSSGPCHISNNRIYENKNDAVFAAGPTKGKIVIESNRIYHNFGFGVAVTNCNQVEIIHNEIFENSFYGVSMQNSTTAVVEKNAIYSNKCGGIFIGANKAGRILIESNTVRDHNGDWLVNRNVRMPWNPFYQEKNDPKVEEGHYAIAPILGNNELRNNKECMFHPKERMESVQRECAFCHKSKNLSRCTRCYIASYCNRVCQEKHWSKHKALCSALDDHYSVTIDPKPLLSTKPSPKSTTGRKSYKVSPVDRMTFGSHLKGIGEGPKPDPKSKRRFIVKIQTQQYNCHPLQTLTAYDKSLSVNCEFQSPEIFNVVMECGVLGKFAQFTSKKAFFYATFVDGGKKLKIYLGQLAPYQDW